MCLWRVCVKKWPLSATGNERPLVTSEDSATYLIFMLVLCFAYRLILSSQVSDVWSAVRRIQISILRHYVFI